MSNCLLKPSSSWFLRPKHLRPIPKEFDSCVPQPPTIQICVTPEEEYCIREYCPVTLNHLLPDLQLTKRQYVSKASEEYDMDLQSKFEEHLEQSHRLISCSSSSETDTESDTENNIDECIENNLNFLGNSKEYKSRSRMLLLPNKINYPEDSMDSFLPNVTLNNNRASSPVFTKSFCSGCISEKKQKNNSDSNMQLTGRSKRSKKYHSANTTYSENLTTSLPPVTNNNQLYNIYQIKSSCSKSHACDLQLDKEVYKPHVTFTSSTANINQYLLSKRRRKSNSPIRKFYQTELTVPSSDEQPLHS
ncbi:hypothetical protein X975_21394, partial [Stegodyphus mimosarum]